MAGRTAATTATGGDSGDDAVAGVINVASAEAAHEDGGGEETSKRPLDGKSSAVEGAALPLGMVLVQVFTTVTFLLSKLALNTGASPFVLLVYRYLVAAASVAPPAFVLERGMSKRINLVVCGWITISATLGVLLAMGMYYCGLRATNAAYSANFLNLIPIVTFFIAIALGAERLTLTNWPGKLKLLGTVMCVGGTMIIGLFKGRLLHLWPTHLLRAHTLEAPPPSVSAEDHHNMVLGTLFLCGSCLSYALWFIVQARLAKAFPCKYWATMLTCLSGSLQSFVVGVLIGSHGISEWKLKWNLQLLTVIYSGVFNTGVTYVMVSWAVTRRGPIYPPMFNSLSLIMTTVMDSVLLGTSIYLGSVLGTLLIIVGLYAFLWGKGKELQLAAQSQKKINALNGEQELMQVEV